MARKLRTKAGQSTYKKRRQTVEPVFGQIKEARGFRRLLLRRMATDMSVSQPAEAISQQGAGESNVNKE